MNKAIAILTSSLLILILLTIFVSNRNETDSTGQRVVTGPLPELPEIAKKTKKEPEPEPEKTQEKSPVSKIKSRGDAFLKELKRKYLKLSIHTQILFDGKPVVGAIAYCVRQMQEPDGSRSPGPLILKASEAFKTKEDGIDLISQYPEDIDPDTIFEIVGYHPEIGIAYGEYTFKKLMELNESGVTLNLETGSSLVGVVVDRDGLPVTNARVVLFMRSQAEQINLTGLFSRTRDDGSFTISGILVGNSPILAVAEYKELIKRTRPQKRSKRNISINPETVSRARSRGDEIYFENRKGIKDEDFNQEKQIWDIGEIVLPLSVVELEEERMKRLAGEDEH